MTILIRGTKIVSVGRADDTRIPTGALVHNATGRYVIPGLWDAHVHLSQTGHRDFPLFLANGITSVRDMGSDLTKIRQWQAEKVAGNAIPRILTPGPKLDGMSYQESLHGPYSAERIVVTSPKSARVAVDAMKRKGVDFIKVHNGMTPDIYGAIAAESLHVGLPFDGHVPLAGPIAAIRAGQRTLEHGSGMLLCSDETWRTIRTNAADHDDAALCALPEIQTEMFPAMVQGGTWFTPTLVSWRGQRMVGSPDVNAWVGTLSGISEVWPALRRHWISESDSAPTAFERELFDQFGTLTVAAYRAGVPLLAGTDLGDPYVVPGYALHDELELMVKAGVPTLTALQSATSEPARAFGLTSTLGSITAGHQADLVLLNANPLSDIANCRRIDAVVLNGRWMSQTPKAAN